MKETGAKVALREKDFGYWNNYTWNDFYDHVRKIALGLESVGVKKGDKLALIGDNIPEMLFMAIGAQSIGAISAGIYQTSLPDEIAELINYMDVTAVFCDDQEQVDKLVEIRDRISPGAQGDLRGSARHAQLSLRRLVSFDRRPL